MGQLPATFDLNSLAKALDLTPEEFKQRLVSYALQDIADRAHDLAAREKAQQLFKRAEQHQKAGNKTPLSVRPDAFYAPAQVEKHHLLAVLKPIRAMTTGVTSD